MNIIMRAGITANCLLELVIVLINVGNFLNFLFMYILDVFVCVVHCVLSDMYSK